MRRVFGSGFDEILARQAANGDVAWYATDRLGSVRAVFDNSATSLGSLDYDAWGNAAGTPADRYQFTGREWDGELDLQFSRARLYSPTTGRWMSDDPLGFAAGDTNLYRFVGNKPLNSLDSSGLSEEAPGHHWVPVELIKKYAGFLENRAIDEGLGNMSGYCGLHNGGRNGSNTKHHVYTTAVEDELKTYMKSKKIMDEEGRMLRKMRPEELREFTNAIRDADQNILKNPDNIAKIKDFNDKVKEKVKEGIKAGRKPLPNDPDDNAKRGKKFRAQLKWLAVLGAFGTLSGYLQAGESLAGMNNPGDDKWKNWHQFLLAYQQGNLNRALEKFGFGSADPTGDHFIGDLIRNGLIRIEMFPTIAAYLDKILKEWDAPDCFPVPGSDNQPAPLPSGAGQGFAPEPSAIVLVTTRAWLELAASIHSPFDHNKIYTYDELLEIIRKGVESSNRNNQDDRDRRNDLW